MFKHPNSRNILKQTPTHLSPVITTSKEKLEKKLSVLRDKHVAYTQLLLLLTDVAEDSRRPQILRDITFSVWRMVQNMQRMVEMAVHSTEHELENVSV